MLKHSFIFHDGYKICQLTVKHAQATAPCHKVVLWLVFVHFVCPSFCLVRTISVCPGVACGETKAFVSMKRKLNQLSSHEVSPKSVPFSPSRMLFLCAP